MGTCSPSSPGVSTHLRSVFTRAWLEGKLTSCEDRDNVLLTGRSLSGCMDTDLREVWRDSVWTWCTNLCHWGRVSVWACRPFISGNICLYWHSWCRVCVRNKHSLRKKGGFLSTSLWGKLVFEPVLMSPAACWLGGWLCFYGEQSWNGSLWIVVMVGAPALCVEGETRAASTHQASEEGREAIQLIGWWF